MRCFQLCEIMRRYGSDKFHYETMPIPNLRHDILRGAWAATRPKEAFYIFVKDAIDRLDETALERLHERASAVLHDPIDRKLTLTPRHFVDVHIASSYTQKLILEKLINSENLTGRIDLLLHQADIRLQKNMTLPEKEFTPAYFGDPNNGFLPDQVRNRISIYNVALTKGMQKNIQHFTDANFHYAVRPHIQTHNSDVIKPLTKAIIAARCGAPVLVNRAAHDAEMLLGPNYPYFVDRTDEASVLCILDQAKDDFQGPRWKAALDAMQALEMRVNPVQTALELEQILERSL